MGSPAIKRPTVFVSHAATDAPIVRVIRDEIDRTFAKGVEVFATSVPGHVAPGGDWLGYISQKLASASAVIVLVTPVSLSRPWIWFEVGASWSRMERGQGKILPLCVPEIDKASLPEPLSRLQAMSLGDATETRLVFQELVDLFGFGNLNGFRHATIKAKLPRYATLKLAESDLHLPASQGEGYTGAITRRLLGGDSEADRDAVDRILDDLESDGFAPAREVSTIMRLYRDLESHGSYGDIAAQWASDHVIGHARSRLDEFAAGRLRVERRAVVRTFWEEAVFGRARSSIWTTNVARPGDNIGGSDDSYVLRVQAAALSRGVDVTRLFVYDPGMTEAEAQVRRQVMRHQLDVGIHVLVMTQAEYERRARVEGAVERIGAGDFMIIDDQLLYLTFPDAGDNIAAMLLSGDRNAPQFDAARGFRRVLHDRADRMTSESIERFP